VLHLPSTLTVPVYFRSPVLVFPIPRRTNSFPPCMIDPNP